MPEGSQPAGGGLVPLTPALLAIFRPEWNRYGFCQELGGKVEAAVECLQEYRTTLIAVAVTGKIDVRKVAVSG